MYVHIQCMLILARVPGSLGPWVSRSTEYSVMLEVSHRLNEEPSYSRGIILLIAVTLCTLAEIPSGPEAVQYEKGFIGTIPI